MDFIVLFFFKQKTAYEMRISDWSSDVCSSDLDRAVFRSRYHRPCRNLSSVTPNERSRQRKHGRCDHRCSQSPCLVFGSASANQCESCLEPVQICLRCQATPQILD